MNYEKSLIKKWQDTHAFDAEKDRFKPKRIIKCPCSPVNSNDFTPNALYPYLYADVYNRYYKMLGDNVFFGLGFNFPNSESYDFMTNHFIDRKTLFNQYQESLDLLGVGYDRTGIFSFYEEPVIKYIQNVFLNEYGKSISFKTGNVLMDSLGIHSYNLYETSYKDGHYYLKSTGEELFYQNTEYYALDIMPLHPKIDEMLASSFLSEEQKLEIRKGLGFYKYLEVPLYNYKYNLKILVKMKKPQYMAGITALLLNPLYMDVMPFVDDLERQTVMRFMQNGYQEGVFTGNTVKNPLTGEDVFLFVSYDFDEAIHPLIPAIYEQDVAYATAFGIEYFPILDNGLMINSDFLNGLEPQEAKEKITTSFLEEGMACELCDYEVQEIIISKKDGYGIPIPVFMQDEQTYIPAAKEFLPIFYNNRKRVTITNEEKLMSNLEFGMFEFNDGFIKAIEPIIISKIDSVMGQSRDPFVGNTLEIIDKNNIFESYFYNLLLSRILNTETSNTCCEMIDIFPTSQKSLVEYSSLNINFSHDILNQSSSDAYRMYILSGNNTENFEMVKLHVVKYQNFVEELEKKYRNGFSVDSSSIDLRFYKLSNELSNCIENNNISQYIDLILHFFYDEMFAKDMSENEALVYLKLISIICPFISQRLFEEVFGQNYLIIYEEWPFKS